MKTKPTQEARDRELRRTLLIENHGTPEEQKDNLVSEILRYFESPDNWPMTDGERIAFIRRVYGLARNIKATEQQP